MSLDTIKTLLGKRIAFLRSSKGLNQSQFAAMLGICNSVLCRYESGIRVPDFLLVEDMARLLELTVAHFATPGPEGVEVTITLAGPKPSKGGNATGPASGKP